MLCCCFLRLSRMKVAAEGRLRRVMAGSVLASLCWSMVTVTAWVRRLIGGLRRLIRRIGLGPLTRP